MNNYPEYVIVGDKKYKINSDYRVALKCNEISRDITISDYERALAIIYLLFGEEALDDYEHYEELTKLSIKFLTFNEPISNNKEERKIDMDFKQDWDYISASFMSDYKIDIDNVNIHWWKFYSLLNGLSTSNDGNCCILNRIRNIRNIDVSKIEDKDRRNSVLEAQKIFSLKANEKVLTDEQKESQNKFFKLAGIEGGE